MKKIIGIVWLLAGIAMPATAGTYNFYFNNTEQGANSKATPNVTVNAPETAAVPAQQPSAQPATQPAPQAQAAPSTVANVEPPQTSEFKRWTVRAGAGVLMNDPVSSDGGYVIAPEQDGSGIYYYNGGPVSYAITTISIGYSPVRGLTLLGIFGYRLGSPDVRTSEEDPHSTDSSKTMFGFEVEGMPLAFSAFGLENRLELGGFVSAATMRRFQRGSFQNVQFGPRANFNITKDIGMTATARFGLGEYPNAGLVSLEGALAIRI